MIAGEIHYFTLGAALGSAALVAGLARMRRRGPAASSSVRRRWLRSEGGQALIELAFMLPVVLVFILVLVDFGLALDRREVIQHAAREGARKGAVGYSVAQIKQEVVDQSQDVLELADVFVCYVDGPDTGSMVGNAGDNVRVDIDYTYQFTAGSGELLAAFGLGPPSIDMTPRAEARLETTVVGAPACP